MNQTTIDGAGIATVMICMEYVAFKFTIAVGYSKGFIPPEMAKTTSMIIMMIAMLAIIWLGTLPVPKPSSGQFFKRKKK